METWSYLPANVVAETITPPHRTTAWGPRARIPSIMSSYVPKRFELEFQTCDTSEVGSMLAFFQAREGGFDPFIWRSAIDARTYVVRFDSEITAELFAPGLFRSGQRIAFLTVQSATITTAVGSRSQTHAGSGGVAFDANSGDGAGYGYFYWPDAWYPVGFLTTDQNPTGVQLGSNELHAQAFWNTRSGVTIDEVGFFVRSRDSVGAQGAFCALYGTAGNSGTVFDGYPKDKLVDGVVTFTSAGLRTAAMSYALPPGVYWLALVTSRGNTSATFAAASYHHGFVTGQQSGASLANHGALVTSYGMGLCPEVFPSSATLTGGVAKMFFHVASVAPIF